jgi:tetratricopeptide repeat protein
MRSVPSLVFAALASGLPAARLPAQDRWVTPQPPCAIGPGHFKVNGGVLHLKAAAEKASQRDQQLDQARDVLTEAILRNGQDKNPAAWYYLGRYYFEKQDGAGADSALGRAVTLAPQCQQDIDGYRQRLWANTLNAGLAAWQEGKEDSATALFHIAARLQPANPKALIALAGLYASKNTYDSALVYYRRTADAAGNDTAFARDKKEALGNAARILVSRAQEDPAARQYGRRRLSVDSIERGLTNDSTTLARIIASSQARKARGGRLSPADQQTFARDSNARALAVTQAKAARASLLQQMAADSSKLQAAFAPAIEGLRAYLTAYPNQVDAATWLATLYAQSGRAAEAGAVFDSVAARVPGFDPEELFAAGQRLMSQGLYRAGTRAMAVGLQRNPYHRDALHSLSIGYYQLRDSSNLLPVAQRLVALDPLSRASLKLVAAGWDLRGQRDSTLRYLARADTGLAVEIAVSSFVPDSGGAALSLRATNLKPAPSKPFRLTVEFLDPRGQVIGSESRDVPTISPLENSQIDVKVSGKGVAGWRYRAS